MAWLLTESSMDWIWLMLSKKRMCQQKQEWLFCLCGKCPNCVAGKYGLKALALTLDYSWTDWDHHARYTAALSMTNFVEWSLLVGDGRQRH